LFCLLRISRNETGLYYRAFPDNTLCAKGVSQERLTLMFACSATGEKFKPTVVLPTPNFSHRDFLDGFGKLSDYLIELILS
jgi:hypothetical protein